MKLYQSLKSHISILLIAVALLWYSDIRAQGGFTAAAVGGLTFSQIDGDLIHGFDKLGVTGGFVVSYDLQSRYGMQLELLYSQRGSANRFGFGNTSPFRLHTDYLELPLVASISDWYIEDGDYYFASGHGGFSLGYLFDIKSNLPGYDADINNYEKIDFSFILGATIRLSSRIGFTVRYTRALTDLRKTPLLTGDPKATQYFWTARTEYTF